MKEEICVAFLAVCLLVLGGTKAAPLDSNSFNGNSAGDGSFNNNGNGFEPPVIYDPVGDAGNHGSFDWNRVGDRSFNDNGDPVGDAGNHGSFNWNRVGDRSFSDNGDPVGDAGNHGSFNRNRVGDRSFNDNGNGFEPPVIYDVGAARNPVNFDDQ